jgi:hypothetical protein
MEEVIEEEVLKKHYYHGRILRISKWKDILNDLIDQLSEPAVLCFLHWLYEECVDYLNEDKNKLPGFFQIIFLIFF